MKRFNRANTNEENYQEWNSGNNYGHGQHRNPYNSYSHHQYSQSGYDYPEDRHYRQDPGHPGNQGHYRQEGNRQSYGRASGYGASGSYGNPYNDGGYNRNRQGFQRGNTSYGQHAYEDRFGRQIYEEEFPQRNYRQGSGFDYGSRQPSGSYGSGNNKRQRRGGHQQMNAHHPNNNPYARENRNRGYGGEDPYYNQERWSGMQHDPYNRRTGNQHGFNAWNRSGGRNDFEHSGYQQRQEGGYWQNRYDDEYPRGYYGGHYQQDRGRAGQHRSHGYRSYDEDGYNW